MVAYILHDKKTHDSARLSPMQPLIFHHPLVCSGDLHAGLLDSHIRVPLSSKSRQEDLTSLFSLPIHYLAH